jgi:hypothetical protein
VSVWYELWRRFEITLSEAHDQLKQLHADATLHLDRSANAVFALRACASFGTTREVELVTVSVDCRRGDGERRCAVDIAMHDGRVLAELDEVSPTAFVDQPTIERWSAEIDAFVRSHVSTLATAMRAHAST